MARFSKKVAVITGGSTGIGFATARSFAREGGRVIITGRHAESLRRAAAEIGSQAIPLVADTSKLEDIDRIKTKISADQLSGLVNIVRSNIH